MTPDPQLPDKLSHARFSRVILLVLELFYYLILLFMLYWHYPGPFLAVAVVGGGCMLITGHLNLVALEDAIGIPQSQFFLFPFTRR